jgi:hypothetical protein
MMDETAQTAGCHLMPHTLGPGRSLAIAVFPDNFIIRVAFRSERKALQATLPDGLSVAGEPIITFMYRHSENVDWVGGGELNAVGATIAVTYQGEDGPVSGAYWPYLWEDDAMAVILGREVFGAAKLYADISNPQRADNGWRARLSERGRPIIDFRIEPQREASADELAQIRAQALGAKVIGWKHIPAPNMKDADLSYPTLFDSPNQIKTATLGRGEVVVHPSDSEVCVWSHHVIESLRAIPLLEQINAVLTTGSGEHRISEGRRLR